MLGRGAALPEADARRACSRVDLMQHVLEALTHHLLLVAIGRIKAHTHDTHEYEPYEKNRDDHELLMQLLEHLSYS
jgi:hypothetical protein